MTSVTKLLVALAALFLAVPAEAGGATGELIAESGWQADRKFAIAWDPIPPRDPTVAAYEIRDPAGKLVSSDRLPFDPLPATVRVPSTPGAYRLEAWLENDAGDDGPHATATLRFDDTVPARPSIPPLPGWVPGSRPATVEVVRPPGAPPLSGIGGYAVSVDRGGGSSPCAQDDRCLAAEIDLGGEAGGALSLEPLLEGEHFVRVVAVSGAGVPSPAETAAVRVDAHPPIPALTGVPEGWSNRPVSVTVRATDLLSGMTADGPFGPLTAIAVDGAAAARAFGGAVSATVAGGGLHEVEYFARDAAGNLADSARAIVRIDEIPPAIAFAAAQDPAEPERIEATVGDPLSGSSPDRGTIGIRPGGSRLPFEPLPTRNSGDRLVAHWDSDSYPPGKYEFLATGFDAAGNAGRGTNRFRGGRMVLVNPLKARVEIAAKLSGRRLSGRLRRFGGGAVSGHLVIAETFAAGSRPRERVTAVDAGESGAFSLRLAPGPSREVVARFAGTARLARAASLPVHLASPSRVGLRASAASAEVGGRPVVFSGRVAHRGAATVAGLPVELQFRFRGGAWSAFRTVETDARGRFRYRYRFSDDDSRGVRFQFRAHVKGREGWPYGPGTSRPVKVTGR